METINFNTNNFVLVKLTDYGREICIEEHDKLISYGHPVEFIPHEEDGDGYSKWQMWELMAAFGKYLYNGGKVPFDTTIKIEVKT